MTKFSKHLTGAWLLRPSLTTPMFWAPSQFFCVRHCLRQAHGDTL